ncbi:MAG: Folylpolyglutamate synthase [Chlamydiae bacterium]|nr:Folylpolyglutamate synthase [Chlamydiota bacterium]
MALYKNLLQRLYSINLTSGMKLGLDNIQRLNSLLGNPDRKFQSVHIAGTNGKGSVSAKIAKGLESKASKVGLFTSPHISCFRERIQINGQMISEADVQKHLQHIFSTLDREGIPATFFEITTQLALCYFATNNVDIAVLETGLGGRLDATNIVSPLLTIITSIGLEHTDILGDTLESISHEKASIIKPRTPVILGPSACHIAALKECQAIKIDGPFSDFEAENRAIAKAALEYLHIPLPSIKKALTTRLPCRMERIPYQEQEVILDVAHNPDALSRLFQALNTPPEKLLVVCTLGKRKNLSECLKIIQDHTQQIHLVDAPNGRCASPERLQKTLLNQGMKPSRINTHDSIQSCLSEALLQAKKQNQKLLICGSFFIMSETRKSLGLKEPQDPFDMNEVVR